MEVIYNKQDAPSPYFRNKITSVIECANYRNMEMRKCLISKVTFKICVVRKVALNGSREYGIR